MSGYDFETEKVVRAVRKAKAKRVALQFPEGLKDHALNIARQVEGETDADVVVMADPTYGACDLKRDQLKRLGVDMLIHYGHTRFDK